jgi:hypothetical protein
VVAIAPLVTKTVDAASSEARIVSLDFIGISWVGVRCVGADLVIDLPKDRATRDRRRIAVAHRVAARVTQRSEG